MLEEAKQIWALLGDIPIDEDEAIEQDFMHFPAGTGKYVIWHYIEENFDCSIAEDLMGI